MSIILVCYLNNLIFFVIYREESYDVLAVADWGQRLSFYQLSGKQVNVDICSIYLFKLNILIRKCEKYLYSSCTSPWWLCKQYVGCICMSYVVYINSNNTDSTKKTNNLMIYFFGNKEWTLYFIIRS